MKLAVCLPGALSMVPYETFITIIRLLHPGNVNTYASQGFSKFSIFDSQIMPISTNRNHLVRQALMWGADWTLWFDLDMSFPRHLLTQLKQGAEIYGTKIISGMYYRKVEPFMPVPCHDTGTQLIPMNDDERGIYKVDVIGMGCALIHADVFRAVGEPYFEYSATPDGELIVSEDVAFCKQVRKAGFDILVDTSLVCSHIIQYPVDARDWMRLKATAGETWTCEKAQARTK